MLERITRFLVNHKLIPVILVIGLTLIGFFTLPLSHQNTLFPSFKVKVDALPDLGENQQIVHVSWEGQSPQDIEDQITYPLTSSLLGISGVKSVRSSSMFGFCNVYVIFEEDIDFYWARSRITEKLNALPENTFPMGVKPRLGPEATALGQIFWYTLEGRDTAGNVTGGWDLQEVRTIQDFYVKNTLASTKGVAEVASVGGFLKEYHVEVDPERMRFHKVALNQVVQAVQSANQDMGARTLEINRAEYFVRGLGQVETLQDLENAIVASNDFTPIFVKDVARVSLGPAERRGILDKGGAEVVGGVVSAEYGENTLVVTERLQESIKRLDKGLPQKKLADGTISKLTLVPFYNRSVLIEETLQTLGSALFFETLIAIFVVFFMMRNLKLSFLVSALVPLAILFAFIAMRIFNIEANIVALAGIAIAIGTVVDMGIILAENISRHLDENPEGNKKELVIQATREVSGAIATAGLTTVVSFLPVFTLTEVEGQLFQPLAFTKTFVLLAAIGLSIVLIPSFYLLFAKPKQHQSNIPTAGILALLLGVLALVFGFDLGWALVLYVLMEFFLFWKKFEEHSIKTIRRWTSLVVLFGVLTWYWRPLGIGYGWLSNGFMVFLLAFTILGGLYLFHHYYERLLRWILDNKGIAISIPSLLVLAGMFIFVNTEREFMPSLEEGDFLLMPTSMPHAGVTEVNQTLKKLDMAVSNIPEIDYVVGKAGRVESALDPAPLSMYENLISYKSEYILDASGEPIRFETDGEGNFKTASGNTVTAGSGVSAKSLVPDDNGAFFRNWRDHIHSSEDIWKEIEKATYLPGVTGAPFLQPIETRQVMLQTGMRANLGIKIKGQNLDTIAAFAARLENVLKTVDEIATPTVFAERLLGKPYVILELKRDRIAQYGLSVEEVQQTIAVAIGGKIVGETIEGRERYGIKVKYPRELRGSPEALEEVQVHLGEGATVPLSELAALNYELGPQAIRGEDGFLTSYLTFDRNKGVSEVSAVEAAQNAITKQITDGTLVVPSQVNYEFSGSYVNHLRFQRTLSFILPLTIALIFLLLYLQFKSTKLSLMVFSAVAVAFSGGFILLWLYGQPWFMDIQWGNLDFKTLFQADKVYLSVAVWVGFIALFGIATDDGVVMGTYLKNAFSEVTPSNKNEIREKVIAAGLKRIRPCLMTTATTLFALIPLLMATGKGSNIMLAMAIPCLGGMFMALISLFVVPLLYCWDKELTLNTK
ncbi:MAG: efflux RND transporter permease subunit [Bacteroidota bacterium]